MRTPAFVCGATAAIVLISVIEGCDNRPKTIVGPSAGAQASVVSLDINGPGSVPPGQSVQFTATSRFSDGTSQTATNVRWSSHFGLLRVDASGLVTAAARSGEDILSAEVSGANGAARGSKEILVVPDGTYRMVGRVTENVAPMTPIGGARVEVTGGAPLIAITDWDGRYVLYGVPGRADIRVTRDGYQPLVQTFQLTDHITQSFQLALSGMRLDLSGPYMLAIDATCATSTPVPTDLQHPRYAAVLTQSGPAVEVVLTESSRFRVNRVGRGDRFSGRVDAAGATFNLGNNFFQYYPGPYDPSTYPTIVERVSDGTFLVVDGQATTRWSPAGLSGDLQGFFLNHESNFPNFPLRSTGTCYSTAHRFTLTRR